MNRTSPRWSHPASHQSSRPGHPGRRGLALAAAGAALAMLLSACGSGGRAATGGSGDSDGAAASGSPAARTLTVLAASSLTESFTTLAKRFEKSQPGVTVRLAFDSSATLAEQVTQGAPADVLATADTTTMKAVTDAHATLGKPSVFATNEVVLVVPATNSAGITTFSDLDKPGTSYVVCVPTAPCGDLARRQLRANHITTKPKSEEVDVKAVLTKVESDEADAGIVYRTDAVAAGSAVTSVAIPTSGQDITDYPLAALRDASDPALATAWVSLVESARGQRVLDKAGFGKP